MSSREAVCRGILLAAVGTMLTATTYVGLAQTAVQAVEWTNLVNATAAGSEIRKTAGCADCADAGGTSQQMIVGGDGYAEFTPVVGGRLYAGLTTTAATGTDPAQIDFAFSFWPDGGWDVRERGNYQADGRFVAGDVFRVALVGGTIKYYQNGSLVYSSTAPVMLPLVLDTTLVSAGAAIASASITGTAPPPGSEPVLIVTAAVPDGVVNEPYTTSLAATGGDGTYTWTIAAGSLPPGLSLSGSGVIAGTPASAGTFAFTVRAADAANAANYDDQALTVFVPFSSTSVRVNTTTIPATRIGQPFTTLLSASGGSGTFVWTIAAGSLPDGVTLDTSGTIGGTATIGGRYTVTVRAADTVEPANADDQILLLTVRAALPPSVYDAISDRITRPKGLLPALGPAGYAFTEPIFGTRMVRVTDGATRPLNRDRSYRTPSGSHTNAWSADARYFYTTTTDGTLIPFAFDSATMTARRINPSASGEGGLTLPFFNEPTFSYLNPGVLYGIYSGSGANLRSVDQYDLETGVHTPILNLDTLAPNLAGTYAGGLGASAGPPEKIFAFFGGTSQGRHFYLVVFDKDNPGDRLLLDTLASTVDGVATNIALNFKIHAAAIDRSGRYVTVYPTGADRQPPRSAAPAYVWDTTTNTFTATPLVETHSGGHDGYGYGYRVNQDCCTSSTVWDAAQWQLRSLATPLTTTDLIVPMLRPEEAYLADHPSWHNAQPVTFVPFIDATYRYGINTVQWRPWDDEIIAVQTEAAGTGATVWRFAHHRSNVTHDDDATRISFWYTPRANVSPDGRWALFTSNWEKTLGTDPGAASGGTFRQDVFLIELNGTTAPPPTPVPVAITTTTLPGGVQGQSYATTLQASGGTGAYSWSVVAGMLPPGLSLVASTGAISGTPSAAGTATFTVRATDIAVATNFDDQVLTISIEAPPTPAVTITTTALPDARRRNFYAVTVAASGGLAPLTWSLASGSLPPGLALNAATGRISGTPHETGTWHFSIRVADAASPATSDTQALSIRVRKR